MSKPIFDIDDQVSRAMLDGFKEAVKSEIKSYIQKDVDVMLEDVATTLANRFYVQISQNNDPFFGDRKVRLEMLFGDPNKPKKFKAEDKTEVVEVKDGN